jgi:hypothetical protein
MQGRNRARIAPKKASFVTSVVEALFLPLRRLTHVNSKASLMKRFSDGKDVPMPFSSLWWLTLAIPFLQALERIGTTITAQSVMHGNQAQRTSYIRADRQRVEYRNSYGTTHGTEPVYGPRLARIVRCDLGQSFELNLDTQEYISTPYPPKHLTAEEIKARGLDARIQQSATPTIRVETKTTDTGERKEIFGRTARHVITTTTQTPLAGSHSSPQESVTDGWYIDFEQRLSCDPKRPGNSHGYIYSYMSAGNGKQPVEKPEFVAVGEQEVGFPMSSTVTSKSPPILADGTITTFETRVTQFEEGPLDPALFQIPPGFKQVDRIERNPPASLGSHP